MSRDRSQVDLSKNKRATEKGRARMGAERRRPGDAADSREGGEISTSSITNSCPSIGCRYIQTLPRKGQSLCRPLCRPRAFLLLSLSTAVAPPPRSLTPISSDALASSFYTSFPPQSRQFSSVKRGGPHSCADGRCGQDDGGRKRRGAVKGDEVEEGDRREWMKEEGARTWRRG